MTFYLLISLASYRAQEQNTRQATQQTGGQRAQEGDGPAVKSVCRRRVEMRPRSSPGQGSALTASYVQLRSISVLFGDPSAGASGTAAFLKRSDREGSCLQSLTVCYEHPPLFKGA